MAAKDHVEEIRRTKFSIGGEPNPLTEDLHQAVKNLSAELYAKDVHFLMELIQNAEDNEYPEGVDPSLEFVITSKDITNTGAPATLLVFNNEKGFSRKNVESICSVGRSTKKGLRKRGYIGEKGIGFKSVFLITSQPYIFSNGYKIRFNEKPCQQCNVGYIVPEWVEDSTLSAIQRVYGSSKALPTTTLVLPLKSEKVKPVKDQLSSIHPEVLLFLAKIKRLSVREDNEDPKLNTVSAISISSEKNFVTIKSMDAESYTLHLTADVSGNEDDTECGYYMWKQRFPVKKENKVDVRSEVEEWVITLAFPNGKRLNRGASMPAGIYSFLPTETVTNFPFIIQADFLLASSRENILWDNKWNQGILDCVPIAFLNSFTSLIKSSETAPISSLPNQFRFLPIKESSHAKLNHVRDAIKAKLMNETIVPCESYTGQKLFRKPNEVGRLEPAFWSILNNAKSQGVSFSNISSHGAYILTFSFDQVKYNSILEFLEIRAVDNEWYGKCIAGSNLVRDVSEELYMQLLVFIADNWGSSFYMTNIKNIPLIKYVGMDGKVNLFSVNACANKLLAADSHYISWLINWNTEFHCSNGKFFLPTVTREAIGSCLKKYTIIKWLMEEVKVKFVSVNDYAGELISSLKTDRKLAVTYAHFLYHSEKKAYLMAHQIQNLCAKMPIVDNYGQVTVRRDGVLVPAKGSKWVELIGSNPWRQINFVELGEDYTRSVTYFGNYASGEDLVSFMRTYVGAADVPFLSPPNAAVPTLSSPLTKTNAFLLLRWLSFLRKKNVHLPERFLSSIKNGSWLKISLSGFPGSRPPSESFMLEATSGSILQHGSVLVDIPLVDVKFYGDEIRNYKEELKTVGVRFENKEACEFIGERLMSLAASSKLTRDNVASILKFIRYLGAHYIPSTELVNRIKQGKWVRTSQGDKTPNNSVLFSHEWNAASQLSNIPFIDRDYYGEVLSFKEELKQLGVMVKFDESRYQLVSDNLKSSSLLNSLSSEAMLLLLKCIQKLSSSDKLVQAVKSIKCVKTNLGYKCPSECFFVNSESEWGCLLQVFGTFPILNVNFYGRSIFSMEKELKKIGVMVDFEDASKEFTRTFKQQASVSSIRKENVFSFLECFRKLKKMKVKLPDNLKKCLREEKWLKTKLGDYRSPNACILFGADWESITPITTLPFIDDGNNFYGNEIHNYQVELNLLGVTTKFKDGAKFVAAGLYLPECSSSITPASSYALLDSVKRLKESASEIPDKFLDKLSQKNWLKTHFGYKCPNECLLFSSDWNPFFKREDGPFIDEQFYGSRIESYREELSHLGVITGVNKGCQVIASYLNSQSNFERINRYYNYLSEFKWEPADDNDKQIWLPRGTDNGEWVSPQDCVLHDKNNLFSGLLYVLEKYKYERKVLGFFAGIFNVKVHPSVDDYCNLWKKWEASGNLITHKECCVFWEFVVKNWNPVTEKTFNKSFSKLPVSSPSSDGIFLSEKRDVFIGDDLFLTDLFQSCSSPIFVWYPQPSSKTLTRTKLVDIYKKLGVRTISESAQKTLSNVDQVKLEPISSKEKFMKKGLVKLILGFLADPNLNLETERRHEAVSRMLGLEAFETVDPMTVKYVLSLSCGDVVTVEAKRMIRWDKQNSKLFMQKREESGGQKSVIEHACHFGEVIAEGMLWENEEVVPQLSELIRLGFLVEFDEEAIEFLMKMKNLQIFLEDHDYLSSIFSS
ncbi:putative histidine kinase/HSP90-like ATPase superfamily [Helianthus annuus]|nr:putative histidine kinase/HSP90-like ATPase superfamily [Helianthus annuus]KAJ0748056.1 putative histidine kinase/HSP90-like ATPase superfamily [Helianthus annuus]